LKLLHQAHRISEQTAGCWGSEVVPVCRRLTAGAAFVCHAL
jgi:hypothetical protein